MSEQPAVNPFCENAKLAAEWCGSWQQNVVQKITDEFNAMKRENLASAKTAAVSFEENASKNRHSDVVCYEHSRIKLDAIYGPNSYIHANEIRLPADCTRYVLTQMPMENTIVDFWRMIWQLKPKVVVALSQPFRDEERCLPLIGGKIRFGRYEIVRRVELVSTMQWTIAECNLKLLDDDDPDAEEVDVIELKYLQWHEWLNDADPPIPDRMRAFVQEIHMRLDQGSNAAVCSIAKYKSNTVVVTCPSGSIRCGLVAASSALVQVVSSGYVDEGNYVHELIKKLHHSRNKTIDTASQYVYLRWLECDVAGFTSEAEQIKGAFEKVSKDEKLKVLMK